MQVFTIESENVSSNVIQVVLEPNAFALFGKNSHSSEWGNRDSMRQLLLLLGKGKKKIVLVATLDGDPDHSGFSPVALNMIRNGTARNGWILLING